VITRDRIHPALGTVLVVAGAVVPLIRQARPWDTLWAEDGQVYVQEANEMRLHATLFRGYAGYGQLASRLLAIPTRWLPIDAVPFYMALAGAVTGTLLALFVYRMAGTHVKDPWARLGLAASCVLLPTLAFENEANVVNATWVLTFAAFWALMSRCDTTGDLVARSLVAFLAVTTNPLAGLLLPLAGAVLWVRRSRPDLVVGGAFAFGAVVQAGMVRATDPSEWKTPFSWTDIAGLYPVRVLASALVGEPAVRALWPRWGHVVGLTAVAVVLVLAAVALRHASAHRSRASVAAVAMSVVLLVVPLLIRGSLGVRLTAGDFNAAGNRYFVVPILLLVSAAAVAVARGRQHWVRAVFAAWVLVLGLTSFGAAGEWRPRGPSWSEGVDNARANCAASPHPTQPIGVAPAGWAATLPCSRLK
jgi:hypothetical protein